MQQQQAAQGQQPTQEQQPVQQQGKALLRLPARRRAALAASQLLQQLLLIMMVQAVPRLPSQLQQHLVVVRVGRGLLAHHALVAHFVILEVVAWVLPQLRSMHASLKETTAWTWHSRQTDRCG
jgi:hypothetical protein